MVDQNIVLAYLNIAYTLTMLQCYAKCVLEKTKMLVDNKLVKANMITVYKAVNDEMAAVRGYDSCSGTIKDVVDCGQAWELMKCLSKK